MSISENWAANPYICLSLWVSVCACATCIRTLGCCLCTGSQLFCCLNHRACCLDVLSVLVSALWSKVQNIKEITRNILVARIVRVPEGKRGWWIICFTNAQKKTLTPPDWTLQWCTFKRDSLKFCFWGLLVILERAVDPVWKAVCKLYGHALTASRGNVWSQLLFGDSPWAKWWNN